MTAAIVAAGITVAGGIYSANQNADAQRSANRQNAALSREELAQQQLQFEAAQAQQGEQFGAGQALNREQFATGATIGNERAVSKRAFGGQQLGGFNQAGQAAQTQQSALLGLGTQQEQQDAFSKFGNSPGQKFMRDRAEKSLLRNSAKLGGLGGGNVRSALVEQGVGFAAQDYNNQLNQLGSVANRGLTAGQTLTSQDLGVSSTAGGLKAANEANVSAKAAADLAAQQAAEQAAAQAAAQQAAAKKAAEDKAAAELLKRKRELLRYDGRYGPSDGGPSGPSGGGGGGPASGSGGSPGSGGSGGGSGGSPGDGF